MNIIAVILVFIALGAWTIANHRRDKSIKDFEENRKKRKIQGQEHIKF